MARNLVDNENRYSMVTIISRRVKLTTATIISDISFANALHPEIGKIEKLQPSGIIGKRNITGYISGYQIFRYARIPLFHTGKVY